MGRGKTLHESQNVPFTLLGQRKPRRSNRSHSLDPRPHGRASRYTWACGVLPHPYESALLLVVVVKVVIVGCGCHASIQCDYDINNLETRGTHEKAAKGGTGQASTSKHPTQADNKAQQPRESAPGLTQNKRGNSREQARRRAAKPLHNPKPKNVGESTG